MTNKVMEWAIGLFLTVGGAALVLKYADKYLPGLVGKGVLWLFRMCPAVAAFVAAHPQEIKQVLRDVESEVEKDIDTSTPKP